MTAHPRAIARRALARSTTTGALADKPTLVIATGAGLAALAMNFWVPFMPLYMKELGATSDADALFWAGLATTGIGLGRLFSGPLWGILSDRLGRKLMFVRALYFATGTTLIAAFAQEPWHVVAAMAFQGFFSGFIPAAIALTSVTVPESKMSSSLGTVSAAQYLGNMIGPGLGGILATFVGFRGAILAGSILPGIAATLVVVAVPRDTVAPRTRATAATAVPRKKDRIWDVVSVQFALAMALYFFLFAAGQLLRISAPVAIGQIEGHDAPKALVALAFTLTGIASVIGVTVVARKFGTSGTFARLIAVGSIATAAAHILLAISPTALVFIAWFCVIALVQAALLPASNTLIASSVPRERRGTAFGLASSVQALAFIAGPMGAAAIASVSLMGGYAALGVVFLAVGLLVAWKIKEPEVAVEA